MNSRERMNSNTMKILTALKLPKEQLKLAKDYLTGVIGEEALEKFDYKDLSSLSAGDVEYAMLKLIGAYYKDNDKSAYDDVCRLINILFAIGQGTCYHMIEDELFERGVCEDIFATESEEMIYKYYVIYANKAFKPDDYYIDFYDEKADLYNFGGTDIEFAGMRKAIDCHTVGDKGKTFLLTTYFKKKYTDKFVNSLLDSRKNLEESSENLAELGRMLILNSINSPIRIDDEDRPLLEMYENMMINSLGSIFDKKIPASVLKDIQKAVRSNDMNAMLPLIRKYGCEEQEMRDISNQDFLSKYGREYERYDIGSWAYQNIPLSSVFKNIVTLCFRVNSEMMLATITNRTYSIPGLFRIGGDFDKLFGLDTRVYIRWVAWLSARGNYSVDSYGNVLERQFQTNKDIYLEILEEEIACPEKERGNSAVYMLEVVKKNDSDLYQSIIDGITKKYRVRYMEDTASRLIRSYERYASKIDGTKQLSDDEQVKIKEYLLGRETLDAIYPIAAGMPLSKNFRDSRYRYVRGAYTYAERFIKLFGDCDFTHRCAIIATFMGSFQYLRYEVFEKFYNRSLSNLSEQKIKNLFDVFEKEGLSIEYQLAANDLILWFMSGSAESKKYNDTVKCIFTRYLNEKRVETVTAFYSASLSGQNFGLDIMEEESEEYKQEILHFAKRGSGFIKYRLLEIVCRHKNWEDDIISLLSSKNRDMRAFGVVVLMQWQSEGADYTELLTSIYKKEKTAKVTELLKEALRFSIRRMQK